MSNCLTEFKLTEQSKRKEKKKFRKTQNSCQQHQKFQFKANFISHLFRSHKFMWSRCNFIGNCRYSYLKCGSTIHTFYFIFIDNELSIINILSIYEYLVYEQLDEQLITNYFRFMENVIYVICVGIYYQSKVLER